jgi:hypothetical protein
MTFSPLSISRRQVLGTLYSRCEPLEGQIPVYLDGAEPELLGHADECLGRFADAFSFHLADDVCKKLSSGQYIFSFEYNFSDPARNGSRDRVSVTAIMLAGRKPYEKPLPRRRPIEGESEL